MFDKIINSGILGDYEYLFKKFEKPRKVYRRDTEKSNRISAEVAKFNKDFLETFFTSWTKSVFLRYAFLISNNEQEKITKFEQIHMCNNVYKADKNDLALYHIFKFVNVNFIDLVDFLHSPSNDVLTLKVSVTCMGIIGEHKGESPLEEQRSFNYDIEFVKANDESIKERSANYSSNCPNCGAPTHINTFGVCEHCQEIVSIYDNIWKIKKIALDD